MDTLKIKAYWNKLAEEASKNMENVAQTGEKAALIVIGAQHPLDGGRYPGPAFRARLDCGIEVYHRLIKDGYKAQFFVPGSRHAFKGVADEISLSEAGTKYLIEKGIAISEIFGVNACKHYRGEHGVYNSSDETLVAARIFFNHAYTELYSIVSPVQTSRVELLFIFRGIIPKVITVPVADVVHGWAGEMAECIPAVLENPAYMDDPQSERCQKHRASRVPEDGRMW